MLATVADTTAPNVSATPDTAANAAGWHQAPVTVTFSGSDVGAVSEPVVCTPASGSIAVEGADQPLQSNCEDGAGNSAMANILIDLDSTAPSVTVSCPAAPVAQNAVANATVTVSDTLSGIASQSAPSGQAPVPTGTAGMRTFTVTATDVAGNVANQSCNYEVTAAPAPPPPKKKKGGGSLDWMTLLCGLVLLRRRRRADPVAATDSG
jgi:hypothetical protein